MDHAAAEDLSEDLRHRASKFVEVDLVADLARDGCYPFAPEPARDDQVEAAEIGVRIQREAVRRHPALDPDADRADLPVAHPGAGHPLLPARLDAVAPRGADHDLLEVPEVLLQVLVECREVEDGVSDDLPRSVVRDIPAARRLHDLDVRP